MPTHPATPPNDPLLDRSRELAEARATIARLQAENDALRAHAGSPLPLPPPLPPDPDPPALPHPASPTVYRGEDPLVRLDRELAEANLQLVNLGMDNAILQNRAEPSGDARGRSLRTAAAAVSVTAGGGLLWLVTGHVVILLPALILIVMLWGLLRLIDTIKPSDP
ncbi:MAG: hypothetical protein ABJE95_24575, partial [Byssovorax sp.]